MKKRKKTTSQTSVNFFKFYIDKKNVTILNSFGFLVYFYL